MMIASLGRQIPRDPSGEVARTFDLGVPLADHFWDIGLARRHRPALDRPGEIAAVLPYRTLPVRFLLAAAISIDELDETIEREARREERVS